MMRSHVLHESALVGLVRYDHPEDRPNLDPDEEVSSHHCISFIERGEFDLHRGGRRFRFGPAALFLTYPGFAYRCRHAGPKPDDVSLSVQYAPALVEDVERGAGLRWPGTAFSARATNRIAYLRHRILQAVSSGEAAMEAPALAGELLAEVAAVSAATSAEPRRLFESGQLAWYARSIDRARLLLSERSAEPLTLETVAREAGMSPFHFSRVFRELVGAPPHRFLLRVRLARAAGRLREGEGVTDTCNATGFRNQSHFIRSFRRAYGVSPGLYAAETARRNSAKKSKKAQAAGFSLL